MKEDKFKKGDKLVAYDNAYWGPKYNHSDVIVEVEQHPFYYVCCFDSIVRRAEFSQLLSVNAFYGSTKADKEFSCSGWMSNDKVKDEDDDKKPEVELPKCSCDMTALMRYGCRCGGV